MFFKFINYYISNIHYNKINDSYDINNNIFNINKNIKLALPKFKWVYLQHQTQEPWMWI